MIQKRVLIEADTSNSATAHFIEPKDGGIVEVVTAVCPIKLGESKKAIRKMSDRTSPNLAADSRGDVTNLLVRWGGGDHSALKQLIPIIYDDLIRLAKARLRNEHSEYTVEPAGLVHEAYLRLADQKKILAENRLHFYAIAANTMRRVLIEQARKRNAQKRVGGIRVTLQTGMDIAEERASDFVVLDEALGKLAVVDARKSRAIELKFFGGLTSEEISRILDISVATVGRELRLGQAWIRRELSHKPGTNKDEN